MSPMASSRIPILDLLLQRVTKSDVETVLIDGKVIFDKGHFTELNRNEVIEELLKSFTEMRSESPEIVKSLRELLRKSYGRWSKRDDGSEYRYNLM
jgi:hypothetical protein